LTGRRTITKGARAPFAAFGAALLLATAVVAGEGTSNPTVSNLPAPGTYALQRIQRVPDARLLDAEGRPIALSTLTRGAITALAFFYGHCVDPAGCPVAWSAFQGLQTEAASDALLRDRLRLVFVSLDPTNDTPIVMRLLQKSQNAERLPPWRFLTSRSQDDLAPLLTNMGQDIAFETGPDGKRTGAVNHLLKVFLIDPEGWAREIYTTAFLSSDNLINDARTLAMAHPEASNQSGAR
jgi:cytochrome oxidase Cu insertion factor (SCO1/SenC/PrrC family)